MFKVEICAIRSLMMPRVLQHLMICHPGHRFVEYNIITGEYASCVGVHLGDTERMSQVLTRENARFLFYINLSDKSYFNMLSLCPMAKSLV